MRAHVRILVSLLVAGTLALGVALPATQGATDRNTLVIAQNTGDLITMDPAVVYEVIGAVIVDQLYDNLVELVMERGTMAVKPELAEKFTRSEDGKTWTFTLRPRLQFPSGRPINAEAVVYSLRRAVRMNKTPAWVITQLGFTAQNADQTIRALDEHNVQLTLSHAFAPNLVLSVLAFPVAAVVDPSVVEQHLRDGEWATNWMKDHSAGSGPYRLIRWERNEIVDLIVNERYWKGVPPVKRIIIRDVPEPTTQRLLLERGDVDVAWNLRPEMVDEMRKDRRPGVGIFMTPAHGYSYVGMNVKFKPFSDERVRQAVRLSIDYDGIINNIYRGLGIKLHTIIPRGYLGYNPALIKPDLGRARKLLAEAGYPNGFDAELILTPVAPNPDVGVKLQSDLARVGIRVKVSQLPGAQLFPKYRAQGHEMVFAGWGVDYPDPDALAKPFADYKTRQIAFRNAWSDDAASDLANKAVLEPDPRKRAQMYKQLTDHVLNKGPYAIIVQRLEYWAYRGSVKGWEDAAALGTMDFDYTRVRKD
ncbi:MAG: ABC transporter substrate-binding protein [Armatimonadetes bacterium]|nr:ABC transporter substrate-binding protein [Armatimonadota bacterium]